MELFDCVFVAVMFLLLKTKVFRRFIAAFLEWEIHVSIVWHHCSNRTESFLLIKITIRLILFELFSKFHIWLCKRNKNELWSPKHVDDSPRTVLPTIWKILSTIFPSGIFLSKMRTMNRRFQVSVQSGSNLLTNCTTGCHLDAGPFFL